MSRQSWRADLRAYAGPALEIAIGLAAARAIAEPARLLGPVWLTVAGDGAVALVALLRIDPAATAASFFLWLARMALVLLPAALLIRDAPRRRWLWLIPLVAMIAIVSSPIALAACATWDRWLLLGIASAIGAMLTRVRYVRWLSLALPILVLGEVAYRHSLNPWDPGEREALLAECAHHSGSRPRNLTADRLVPYHGITALGDDLVLLTAEGPEDGAMRGRTGGRRVGSWWLRRDNGTFTFETPSDANGNLWRGCQLDGALWMARANFIVGARRLPDGEPQREQVYRLRIPSSDVDFGETACLPDRKRVYVGEASMGGLWEVRPDGTEPRRHQIGGVLVLPKARPDGRLVITTTASLMTFAPGEDRVVDRTPAGLIIAGYDVCPVDGSVAVADLAGRVRVFHDGPDGRYRFDWGVSLFAPRRVAYSRDCSRMAVTSADDRRVFVVDTAAHRVVEVIHAGPALREVAATGPREFAVADVCSMSTHTW
jgi:hypothetical protein